MINLNQQQKVYMKNLSLKHSKRQDSPGSLLGDYRHALCFETYLKCFIAEFSQIRFKEMSVFYLQQYSPEFSELV